MEAMKMYDVCTEALGEFVRGIGFSDVVIGLSGGMDSSLVAVMAADALGAEHVHGVMLPGPYSSESSIDDAEALAANLDIEVRTVSICEPFEAFESVLARALPPRTPRPAAAWCASWPCRTPTAGSC